MSTSRGTLPTLTERTKAELYLGQWYLDRGVSDQAFRCFRRAAETGHPMALNMLGRAYERGWGVARDVVQARALFEASAEAGDGWACFNLADLCLTGDSALCDVGRAYTLYVKAAQRGITKSYNMLGLLHEDGFAGHPPDMTAALQFYEAGAKAGDEWAQLNLTRVRMDRPVREAAAPQDRTIRIVQVS